MPRVTFIVTEPMPSQSYKPPYLSHVQIVTLARHVVPCPDIAFVRTFSECDLAKNTCWAVV